MYQRVLMIAVFAVALSGGSVYAQETDATRTAVLSGTIKGTATPAAVRVSRVVTPQYVRAGFAPATRWPAER